MQYPKFIIVQTEEDPCTYLRLGKVNFHKDLLEDPSEKCLGGGMFLIDKEQKKLSLYGDSYDFGFPKFEHLKYVPKELEGFKITYYEFNQFTAKEIQELSNEEIVFV